MPTETLLAHENSEWVMEICFHMMYDCDISRFKSLEIINRFCASQDEYIDSLVRGYIDFDELEDFLDENEEEEIHELISNILDKYRAEE